MEFRQETGLLSAISADAVVLAVFQEEKLPRLIAGLDGSFPAKFLKQIADLCQLESFEGKFGQSLILPTYGQLKCKKLILWGLGKSDAYSAGLSRKLSASVARRLSGAAQAQSVCLFLRLQSGQKEHLQAVAEGWLLGAYSFLRYKTVGYDNQPKAKRKELGISGVHLPARDFNAACRAGRVIAEATNLARDLIAEPAGYMTPTRLAREARRLSKSGVLACSVYDRSDMERMGMGALLGVARGAHQPPKFIVLKYNAPKAGGTIALIGKGITFDSGGLSLKTPQGMEHMKYDMSGAAVILGTMQAISHLKPGVSVIGVVAAAENMPGGGALHPGDVVTAMNGKTIEVNNTDAEGRLVLADALVYALRQKPDEIVDVATLTGAIVTALGREAAGLMGNDQKLIDRLMSASEAAGEKLWRMPLYDEYREFLKSDIADLKNAGARGEAASSAAGMFLKEFVDGKPWAHLDIAGPAWRDREKEETNKGGTAFGVRTLCRYVMNRV